MLWVLGTLYVVGKAHELGEQLLRLAQRRHDSALLVEAHYALGFTLFHLGEPAPARTHLEQGSALYDAQQHHSLAFSYGSFDPGVACLSIAAEDLWLLGYPEQALKSSHEALRVLSTEQGFPFWLGGGTIFQGWALAEQGHGAEGLSQIREGLAAWRATGAEFFRSNLLALLAEAYGKDKPVEDGLRTVAEALAFVESTEERFYEAESYRLKGELILQKS